MRPTVVPLALLTVLAVAPAHAQDEATLKRALEGREVALLLEMPATHLGLDLRPQREPEIDFSEYARRIKQYGVALRRGDRVMVTQVKVNKKNIEVHLGGGGFGTWGDDTGGVYLPPVEQSAREKQLERDVKREKDPERKRRMERELATLRLDRLRDDQARARQQRELTALKQREVAMRRLDAGSRLNVWYDDKRLERWAPTPDELILAMARYVDFALTDGQPVTDARLLDPSPASGVRALRRGMTTEEVRELLGAPTRRRETTQGDLLAVVETWETVDEVTEVTFVGGVVVKFSTSSR